MLAEEISVPKPLGVGEAAQICRVTTRTINYWIKAGKLKAYTTPGGHFRIWPNDLRDFLKAYNMNMSSELGKERRRKVLIIESDEAYSDMMRNILLDKFDDCEFHNSHDGYEALIILGDLKPDLVVLDLTMPGVDGFRMLELISDRSAVHPLKILVLSGSSSSATVERLRRSRVNRWLTKPVSTAELIHSVQNLLTKEDRNGGTPT